MLSVGNVKHSYYKKRAFPTIKGQPSYPKSENTSEGNEITVLKKHLQVQVTETMDKPRCIEKLKKSLYISTMEPERRLRSCLLQ